MSEPLPKYEEYDRHIGTTVVETGSPTSNSPDDDVSKDEVSKDISKVDDIEKATIEDVEPAAVAAQDNLARKLSARQVSMIAIGGTIGTGLFLGTGKSLATGGPASMLIAYALIGAIVYITMLSLGEMATFIPIAGSFCAYAGRFVDDSFAFALTWNYWFNAAVSVASDLTAVQLVIQYWTTSFPGYAVSIIFWVFLVSINVLTVAAYGEIEYVLSLLKVVTIIIFILLGIIVNCGGNTSHTYIGGSNWFVGDAPFVGGIGGFASVFVTAAYAYGGTETIGITAGETKNPHKTMPRVVKNVFWRILLFYVLSILIIGLDLSYLTPGLNEKNTRTSPFTSVFQLAGGQAAGSFINAVIMSSVISSANHSLFAGARLMYTLSVSGHAPRFFGRLNRAKVPYIAALITALIGAVCFGASFIGTGEVWTWLQNIAGVSNQLAWAAIGVASVRFRGAVRKQGKEHLLPFKNWTYPYGPWACIFLNIFLILVQGWTSFAPKFDVVSFVSLYFELPVMLIMYLGYKLIRKTRIVKMEDMDLETDRYRGETSVDQEEVKGFKGRMKAVFGWLF